MIDSGAVLIVAGIDCEKGREDDFNNWYNSTFPGMMLSAPGVIRVDRYEQMDDDERIPKFMSVVHVDSEESFELLYKSEVMKKIADIYLKEGVQWDLKVRWVGRYKTIYSSEG